MNFISLLDYSEHQINEIFRIADEESNQKKELTGKTAILFFPETSIRTRITFEKGIFELGGQPILFPPETLDKKEKLSDVIGYIQNWANVVIIRHSDINIINEITNNASIPIINAMTKQNHPCEILSDIYSIRKHNKNYQSLTYTFVGPKGNILNSWINIAQILNLELIHVSELQERLHKESKNYIFSESIEKVLPVTDILLTDPLPRPYKTDEYYRKYQISKERIDLLPEQALINPCPPFYRGEEISESVIESKHFVGYEFKKDLLNVQKAIIKYCMRN